MSNVLLQEQFNTMQSDRKFNWFIWLTVPAVIATFIVTFVGIINPDVYRNSDSLAAQGQAQDLVTMLLVIPTLLISTWYMTQNSIKAKIIWLGAMLYLAYTYAIAAFQVNFNQLFLFYVIILACAFYSIIIGFFTIRQQEFHIHENAPRRVFSILAIVFAMAYYMLWLADDLPAVMNNTIPEAIIMDNIPTSAVHVLDMAFYLPLLLIGAVLLWQNKPIGFVLTGTAFAFGPLMGVAVAAMVINMHNCGIIDSVAPIIIFAITTLITGAALIWMLRYVSLPTSPEIE